MVANSALFLTKTVPSKKSSDMDDAAVEFVHHCLSNRTLRTAAMAVRDATDQAIEWSKKSGGYTFSAVVSEGTVASWFVSELDGSARVASEFSTSRKWNAKEAKGVAMLAFKAMESFGVISDIFCGSCGRTAIPRVVSATHNGVARIAKLIADSGFTGERIIKHDAWRWLGMCREDVEYQLCVAHQYKLLSYYACGSVVSISFSV